MGGCVTTKTVRGRSRWVGVERGHATVAVWLAIGAVALAACGSTSGSGEKNSRRTGDDNSGAAGGVGGAGAASTGGVAATGGTVSDLPSWDSLVEACRVGVLAQCQRRVECGKDANCELIAVQRCPDALFSEGSLRTKEGVLACAEEWKTFSCRALYEFKIPECAILGTLEVGSACAYSSQCSSGLCDTGGTGCGECVAVGDGQSCGPDLDCPAGAWCLDGSCHTDILDPATYPEGAPPPGTVAEAHAPCVAQCVPGYVCAYDPGADERRCLPDRKAGEPCYLRTSESLAGSRCMGARDGAVVCDESGICRERPGEGSPCLQSVEARPSCADGHLCDETLTCRAFGGPGSACLSDQWGRPACDIDELCVEGTCRAVIPLGGACSGALSVCENGTQCQSAVCVPDDSLTEYAELCGL